MGLNMNQILQRAFDSINNRLRTDATLIAGDIQIGAVELKNADTDVRASILADGGTPTAAVGVMIAGIDTAGNLRLLDTDLTGSLLPRNTSTADDGSGAVAVGSSTTVVAAANADRIALTITNDSDETIYLALGEDAVLNQGIRLNANGGSYQIDSLNMWTGAVNAISTSGSKVAVFVEY